MDGLRRLPHGIALELQVQRRLAVRSLGVAARVMALLNQHVGRWSLRGDRSKARQVLHQGIDLLFDEAAMVNEPFLDLVASLVAGIDGVDGEGWPVAREERRGGGGGCGSKAGLTLQRGPIKKPARALQKLVRSYAPAWFLRCSTVGSDACTTVMSDGSGSGYG